MPQSLSLRAGQRTKVVSYLSDSISRTISFDIRGDAAPSGTIDITSRWMLVRAETKELPLGPSNTLEKSWLQSPYAIHVTSETDAELHFPEASRTGNLLIYALAGLVVLAAIAAVALPLLLQNP